MRPFDPHLLCYVRPARGLIAVTALLGILTALLILAQALLISAALSSVVSGTAFLADAWPFIVGTAAVFACRALIVVAREAVSTRAAAVAVRELHGRAVDATVTLGSRWRVTRGTETMTLLSTGLEDLRPYLVSFLPQLVLVYTVTLVALGVIFPFDFWFALIAFLAIPLVPIFTILIGRFMQAASEGKPASMKCLTVQLLDLMSGLSTLRGLGREEVPRAHLHALGVANTRATMTTPRVVFLSGGVFEFLTILSVALVVVEVGMRLVFGSISLLHGLAVIMLAPEVSGLLRQVGVQFHVSANGVTASKAASGTIEEAETVDSPGTDECPDMARTDIVLDGLGVCVRDAWVPAPTSDVIASGTATAPCGPSGMGKSMIVLCLLADMTPDAGRVLLRPSTSLSESGESVLLDIDPAAWRRQILWVSQSPTLVPGTILDNMGDLPLDDPNDVAATTSFDDVLASTPDGWNTVIGSGGVGLSTGQRQRLALTRALAAHPRVVILDEPTTHLDAVSEKIVVRVIDVMWDVGRTVIVIAHRAAMMEAADAVIDVCSAADEEARV